MCVHCYINVMLYLYLDQTSTGGLWVRLECAVTQPSAPCFVKAFSTIVRSHKYQPSSLNIFHACKKAIPCVISYTLLFCTTQQSKFVQVNFSLWVPCSACCPQHSKCPSEAGTKYDYKYYVMLIARYQPTNQNRQFCHSSCVFFFSFLNGMS